MAAPKSITIDFTVTPDDLDGGFVAQVVGHPGIMSQGETEREAVENALDAYLCVVSATFDVDVIDGDDHDPSVAHNHRVTIPA